MSCLVPVLRSDLPGVSGVRCSQRRLTTLTPVDASESPKVVKSPRSYISEPYLVVGHPFRGDARFPMTVLYLLGWPEHPLWLAGTLIKEGFCHADPS